LYVVVGLLFAVGYVVTPDGPWRWLVLAIAVVSLARAGLYLVRAKAG
jgi:Sec-independent protein secretion pathway component TatC